MDNHLKPYAGKGGSQQQMAVLFNILEVLGLNLGRHV
jgi:hypothetical protein